MKQTPKAITAPTTPSTVAAPPSDPEQFPKLNILLNEIRMDGGTQLRDELDPGLIDQYHQDMLKGDIFPPVVLFFDGTFYWLADGFYRTHATMKISTATTIAAEIHQGTVRDAILYAIGANANHGKRRSNKEKRKAVLWLLEDAEWKKNADNVLAKIAKVTQPFVSTIRRELSQSISSDQPDIRIGADGKERNIANIGRRKKEPEEIPLIDMSQAEDTDITPLDTDFHVTSQINDSDPSPTTSLDQKLQGSLLGQHEPNLPTSPHGSASKERSLDTTQLALTHSADSDDPEGWSDLKLKINITVKPGKSSRRGIMISGQTADHEPRFLTEFTFADLEPVPPAILALIDDLKNAYTKHLAKEAKKAKAATARKTKNKS